MAIEATDSVLVVSAPGRDVRVTLRFVLKDPLHEVEKLYVHSYAVEGIRRTNLIYHAVEDLEIRDLRKHTLTYSEHGIAVARLITALAYHDFESAAKVESCYLREARRVIRDVLKTKDVHIIDYKVSESIPRHCLGTL